MLFQNQVNRNILIEWKKNVATVWNLVFYSIGTNLWNHFNYYAWQKMQFWNLKKDILTKRKVVEFNRRCFLTAQSLTFVNCLLYIAVLLKDLVPPLWYICSPDIDRLPLTQTREGLNRMQLTQDLLLIKQRL